MPIHPPNDQPGDVSKKHPGLGNPKPVKSISVERSLDSTEKVVTETNLEPLTDQTPPRKVRKKRDKPRKTSGTYSATEPSQATNRSTTSTRPTIQKAEEPRTSSPQADGTVLELPPSPEQRKAKRRKAIWLWLTAVLVFLAGGSAFLYFSPVLAIEEIAHEGLDLVAESEATARSNALLGTPLPQVTDRKATDLFDDNPAVDTVTVSAEPPHGLVMIVHEHRPIAMSPRAKQYVVFSESGTELAEIPAKKAQEFDLPVVAFASDVADQEVFATITEVLGSLPDEMRDQVRVASGTSIDSIELEMSSGKMVMWGNSEYAEKKVRVLDAFLGLDEEQAAEISEYDVSAPDFPVTR